MKIKNEINWRQLSGSLLHSWRPLLFGILLGALMFGVRWTRPSDDTDAPSDGAAPNDSSSQQQLADEHHADGKSQTWTCAMHPQIRQSEAGSCPICGMDLVPVVDASSSQQESGRVKLSARAIHLARLRTTPVVRKQDAHGQVRLLGRIAPDEETLKNITAWIGGRIDRLYVNTTGQRVHAGQKVASLYSPEVYSAHQDLITAAAQVQRLQDGSESARRAAEAALSAARQRLSLLGVPGDEVARMQKQEKPTISISIHSPFSGTVMQRFATEGSYVTTGARLYSVADLASLWIELDAYEKDLPLLSVGQNVDVAVEAYPGETFVGRVTFIEPTLDQHLRTSKVRVQLDNKDRRLRPGMFGQAVVASEQGLDTAPLVIPASAPLFTGRRSIVYVEVPGQEGLVYDARTVRLGPRLGDSYPVVAGLTEGERVVVRGAFALDADLQIKGGRSMMMSPDDSESGTWDELIHVSRSKLRPLRETMEQYLAIQKALSADDLPAAKQGATELRASLSAVDLKQPVEVAQAWDHVQGMLSGGAQHIAQADSIEQARKGFEHLSGAVIMLLRTFGNPMDRSLTLAHCPMARGSEGANWVQEGTQIENSYFGEAMRTCGDIQAHIEPGGHLAPPGRTRGNSTPQPMEGHDH